MANRDVVIQYYDVMLRKDDVRLLNDNMWFNDTIIEFYYEYLERTLCKSNPEILLLRPGIAHLISHAKDTSFFDSALPPQIHDCSYIFIPVNDNDAVDRVGGSHWSTLVFVRASNTFLYYDTLNDCNLQAAWRTADKFSEVLNFKDSKFTPMKTPRQANGSDCGVYVTTITEHFCTRLVASTDPAQGANPASELWEVTPRVGRPELHAPAHHRRRMRMLLEELLTLAGGIGGVID